jgi:hypothetical protein
MSKRIQTLCGDNKDKILADINNLQLTKTDFAFDVDSEIFLGKWNTYSDFCTYFENEWLKQNRFWYEGAGKGVPSTNNALESTNNVFKNESTLRERIPIHKFKVVILEV